MSSLGIDPVSLPLGTGQQNTRRRGSIALETRCLIAIVGDHGGGMSDQGSAES
jgi:hypothetical protein